MRQHERPVLQVEHVELDQVDAHLDRRAKRAQRVLGRERRRTAMADPEHATLRTVQLDHVALARVVRPTRRIHHAAARPTATAWPTTIAAASIAVSCQKASG